MKKHPKNRAKTIINFLKMAPHPEGGHYCRSYCSDVVIKKESLPCAFNGARALSSAIYFLLEGDQFSALHRIKSDEIWHFYEGAALNLSIISPSGKLINKKLGTDIEAGEEFQIVVPAGSWFGADVTDKESYTLFGCTVAPGFDFEDFELGSRNELIKIFPIHAEIIRRLTKESE